MSQLPITPDGEITLEVLYLDELLLEENDRSKRKITQIDQINTDVE